jgi:SPP1 gp7 family putative phage head morphogenesis protein
MSYAATQTDTQHFIEIIDWLSYIPGLQKLDKVSRALPGLPRDSKHVKKATAAMHKVMADFFKDQAPVMAAQVMKRIGKAEGDDIHTATDAAAVEAALDTLDFSGWTVVVTDNEAILEEIFKDQAAAALAQVGIDVEANKEAMNIVNDKALQYARDRAAEMVGMRRDELGNLYPNPNAKYQITEATREMMRGDVETAIDEGWTTSDLAKALADSYGFSDDRATVIARTEVNFAQNKGALDGYKASGVVQGKLWLTADDDLVEEECEANADAGVLGLDEDFPSGDEAPPAHPNCRCAVAPVVDFDMPDAAPAASTQTEEE